MKKLLLMAGLSLALVACSDEAEPVAPVAETKQTETKEPTQAELDAALKEEAIAVSFIDANGDKISQGTKVTITGEVTNIAKEGVGGTFTVTTKESDGLGMYDVTNVSLEDVTLNQTVTIYGTYDGKSELGAPSIAATIIE